MSRVAIDEFGDREIARIYLAARLAVAQRVEAELNKHNIEYAVEVENYAATAVFRNPEYGRRRIILHFNSILDVVFVQLGFHPLRFGETRGQIDTGNFSITELINRDSGHCISRLTNK